MNIFTDEDIKEIVGPWGDTPIKGYTRSLFDKIEAKLREKQVSNQCDHGHLRRSCEICQRDDEITALKAERDALLADAERYRYLRNRKKDEVFSKYGPDAGCWIDCEDEQQDLVLLTGDDADAAIDAARGE